jgi:hypothetical protein
MNIHQKLLLKSIMLERLEELDWMIRNELHHEIYQDPTLACEQLIEEMNELNKVMDELGLSEIDWGFA